MDEDAIRAQLRKSGMSEDEIDSFLSGVAFSTRVELQEVTSPEGGEVNPNELFAGDSAEATGVDAAIAVKTSPKPQFPRPEVILTEAPIYVGTTPVLEFHVPSPINDAVVITRLKRPDNSVVERGGYVIDPSGFFGTRLLPGDLNDPGEYRVQTRLELPGNRVFKTTTKILVVEGDFQ